MRPTLVKEILDSEGNVIKPFEPDMLWDITRDPLIHVYDENFFQTDEVKVVEPWVVDLAKEGMREVVVSGTAKSIFEDAEIQSAGKTGTAEYCDDIARPLGKCISGSWPAHAWYVGYAPYDNPEIAVVAFIYDGDEGAILAAPVVRQVLEAYFELKTSVNP
jgi:penicillin-binding protein 2